MMKRLYSVIAAIGIVALLLGGCDSTGADSGGSDADDGTVTVSLSGATDLTGDLFAVFLYAHDEHSIHTAGRLLAVNYATIGASGNVDLILKQDDGNWGPTGTNFVGTAGTTYDLYIYTDSEDDGTLEGTDDYEPATSFRSYRTVNYPRTVTIDGDQTVSVARDAMVDYTGGTVTVTLSDAGEHDGKMFFYGIFLSGADPGADDVVAYAEKMIAEGSADGTEVRARFEEMVPWYAVDGTSYDLYAFIDMDESGHSDGPTDGDLAYQLTFTVNGDTTIPTTLADYEEFSW